jgi:hypothetical protein
VIALETNPTCPAGLVAATALEHLGEPYALKVVSEGHFLERYGTRGRRTIEGDRVRMNREAVRELVGRCVQGASTAAKDVADHVRERLTPTFVAGDLVNLAGELHALDALLALVPRADVEALVPILVPLGRALERVEKAQSRPLLPAPLRLRRAHCFGAPASASLPRGSQLPTRFPCLGSTRPSQAKGHDDDQADGGGGRRRGNSRGWMWRK